MNTQAAIIGGGAAGLMAAVTAAERGLGVTVIERMPRPARKLMITGKGRCNVTNNTDVRGLIAAVNRNPKFLYSAFSDFDAEATMHFFENLGVPLKTERGNRVFPVSDKAVDIVDALVNRAKALGVHFVFERAVSAKKNENGFLIKTESGEIKSEALIVATGGVSYPLTGSSGDGYRFAESFSHTVTPLKPSIVPLVCFQGFVEELKGLTLKNVGITVKKNGAKKPCYTDFGDMIFTDYGVSGPIILSASAHMGELPETQYSLEIDLKPALDKAKLDARLIRDFEEFSGRDLINSLDKLLPKRLIPIIVRLSGIAPHTRVAQITKEERLRLVDTLKCVRLDVIDKRPIEEAIVTVGGVKTSEINPATMESKLCKNLYFAGEVIDVDAYTGGYNLQIAFSTGHAAGKNILIKD